MKKSAILLLLSIATLISCNSQTDLYYLHGSVKEKDIRTVYLISSNQVVDSAVVDEQGHFSMHGSIDKPALAYITDARTTREASLNCTVILEPGDLLTMVPLGKFDEYKVDGGKCNRMVTEMMEYSLELTQYYEMHEGEEGIIDEVEGKWNAYLEKNAKKTQRQHVWSFMPQGTCLRAGSRSDTQDAGRIQAGYTRDRSLGAA